MSTVQVNRGRRRPVVMSMIVAVMAALGLVAGTASASAAPLGPIAKLDVDRYLGVWNQVAAIPQPFNIDCLRNTQARYTLIDPNNIKVENTCTKFTGQRSGITGNARVNDQRTKAQLHVSFPGVPFQSSKSGPTNYIVTYIAPDYSWALVGSPERLSGFVLKRDKQVSSAQWRQIKNVIVSRGYNLNLFITTPIDGAYPNVTPLALVR
ncbi:lipocalin family protein [Williamsia herbipolensis]|uniref:lipocalin family protein n=1 Tax=Williamsia herbipolensis TaxID=1603258 RepID=UPI000A640F54